MDFGRVLMESEANPGVGGSPSGAAAQGQPVAGAAAGGGVAAVSVQGAGSNPQGAAPAANLPGTTQAQQGPSFNRTVEYLMKQGYTDEQVYEFLTKPIDEPARAAAPQPNYNLQPVGMTPDQARAYFNTWQAESDHNKLLSAQPTVFAPDVEKYAGNDATMKAVLTDIAAGIASRALVGAVYPAGHPLAGRAVPLTPDVWAAKGRSEFEKAVAAVRGQALRSAAANAPANGIPGGAPPTGGTPPAQFEEGDFRANLMMFDPAKKLNTKNVMAEIQRRAAARTVNA